MDRITKLAASQTSSGRVIGHEQNGQQADAVYEIRQGCWNEIAGGSRQIVLGNPDVAIGCESQANKNANNAKDFCRYNVGDFVIAAPGHVQGQPGDQANNGVANIPVPVNAIAGDVVAEEVAHASGE